MGGFNSISDDPDDVTIGFADNFSFDGTERDGKLTSNLQIWAGSTIAPHVRKTTLFSSDGSVTFSMAPAVLPDLSATLDIKAVGGGGGIPTNIGVDTTSGTGANPAIPDGSNIITITGGQVASGTVGANVVRTNCFSASDVRLEIQRAGSAAATDSTLNGVCHFDTAQFTIDANGFVSIGGSGLIQTLTGNSGEAVSPTAGNINTLGAGSITVAGNPGTSTLTAQLQGLTANNLLIGQGTSTIGLVAPGTTNQVLMTQPGTDPFWSTATYPRTTTINQLLYSSATNTVTEIPTLNDGVLITGNTGIPYWLANGTTNYVLTATAGAPPSWQPIPSGSPGLVLITTIEVNNGDTYTNFTNVFNSSYNKYLIIGSNLRCSLTAQYVLCQYGSGAIPTWITSDYETNTVSGNASIVIIGNGTSGQGQFNFEANVFNANRADKSKVLLSLGTYGGSAINTLNVTRSSSLKYTTVTTISSIRFFWSSGTWVEGEISIYGYTF